MSSLYRRILRADAVEASSVSVLLRSPPGPVVGEGRTLEDLLEQTREEGRSEGYAQAMGEVAAAEAAGRAAQLRRVADALVDAASKVAESRREAVSVAAAEAAELGYQLAEAFLQRELRVGAPALEAVSRALRLVPEEHDLVVRLNPGDAVEVDEVRRLVPDTAVRVIADTRVEPGACVVVAGPCRVDTQIGSAMARARQVLAELYSGADPEDATGAASRTEQAGVPG